MHSFADDFTWSDQIRHTNMFGERHISKGSACGPIFRDP